MKPPRRITLVMIGLVGLALLTTAGWAIVAPNWQARGAALATLVVLAVASVYLLGTSGNQKFKH